MRWCGRTVAVGDLFRVSILKITFDREKIEVIVNHLIISQSIKMTSYNHHYEPTAINELILEHIDFVMHEECEKKGTTQEDSWNIEIILSQERFGTICATCTKNREKLLLLIPKWQSEYDYDGVIRRGTTEYRELPYKIKYFCERIAMDYVQRSVWTPYDLYYYGRNFYMKYMGETDITEIIDLKISNAINERNIEYLLDKFMSSKK